MVDVCNKVISGFLKGCKAVTSGLAAHSSDAHDMDIGGKRTFLAVGTAAASGHWQQVGAHAAAEHMPIKRHNSNTGGAGGALSTQPKKGHQNSGTVQDSPSPPASSTSVGQGPSSAGSLSSSSRHGITVDIPVGAAAQQQISVRAEAEEASEARPMSTDMGRPMSIDLTPTSPSMGGIQLWTRPAHIGGLPLSSFSCEMLRDTTCATPEESYDDEIVDDADHRKHATEIGAAPLPEPVHPGGAAGGLQEVDPADRVWARWQGGTTWGSTNARSPHEAVGALLKASALPLIGNDLGTPEEEEGKAEEQKEDDRDEGQDAGDECRMAGSNQQDDYDEAEEGVWREVSSGVGAASVGGSTTDTSRLIDTLVLEIARSNLDHPGKGGSIEGGVVDGEDEGGVSGEAQGGGSTASGGTGGGGIGGEEGNRNEGEIGDGRVGRQEGKGNDDERKNGGGGHGGLEGTAVELEIKEEEETKERNEMQDDDAEKEEMGESGGKGQKGTKEGSKYGGGEDGGGKARGRVGRGSTGEEGGLGGRRVSEQGGREDGRNPVSPKSPVVSQQRTPMQPLSVSERESIGGSVVDGRQGEICESGGEDGGRRGDQGGGGRAAQGGQGESGSRSGGTGGAGETGGGGGSGQGGGIGGQRGSGGGSGGKGRDGNEGGKEYGGRELAGEVVDAGEEEEEEGSEAEEEVTDTSRGRNAEAAQATRGKERANNDGRNGIARRTGSQHASFPMMKNILRKFQQTSLESTIVQHADPEKREQMCTEAAKPIVEHGGNEAKRREAKLAQEYTFKCTEEIHEAWEGFDYIGGWSKDAESNLQKIGGHSQFTIHRIIRGIIKKELVMLIMDSLIKDEPDQELDSGAIKLAKKKVAEDLKVELLGYLATANGAVPDLFPSPEKEVANAIEFKTENAWEGFDDIEGWSKETERNLQKVVGDDSPHRIHRIIRGIIKKELVMLIMDRLIKEELDSGAIESAKKKVAEELLGYLTTANGAVPDLFPKPRKEVENAIILAEKKVAEQLKEVKRKRSQEAAGGGGEGGGGGGVGQDKMGVPSTSAASAPRASASDLQPRLQAQKEIPKTLNAAGEDRSDADTGAEVSHAAALGNGKRKNDEDAGQGGNGREEGEKRRKQSGDKSPHSSQGEDHGRDNEREDAEDMREFQTCCWECKSGKYMKSRNSTKQCRKERGHTGPDWREVGREREDSRYGGAAISSPAPAGAGEEEEEKEDDEKEEEQEEGEGRGGEEGESQDGWGASGKTGKRTEADVRSGPRSAKAKDRGPDRCWECSVIRHISGIKCRSAPPLGKGHTAPAYKDDPRYATHSGGGSRYGLTGASGGGLGGVSGGMGGARDSTERGDMGGGGMGGGGSMVGARGEAPSSSAKRKNTYESSDVFEFDVDMSTLPCSHHKFAMRTQKLSACPTPTNGMGGGPAGGGGMGGGGDIDTENSATLIPDELVSFCENKGGFTPIYEPEDGCRYADYAGSSVHAMASVNAGAFRLYVGGAAMNKGFALMLKGERHDVHRYEDMHWKFYEAVDKEIQSLNGKDSHTAQRVQGQLHFLSESGLLIDTVEGTHDMCLLLSSLPNRFMREGVRAGTIFIDTFKETHRPCKNKANTAMIYCVGPEGNQARDAKDFIDAVKGTGQNLFRAVRQYNQPTANRVPIDFVRVCLVSGGLFIHPEVTKVEVAQALISGISAGFLEGSRSEAQEEGGRIHFNFAFDENVFKDAYNQLRAQ